MTREINPEDILGKAPEDPLVQSFLLAGGGSIERDEFGRQEDEGFAGDGEVYFNNLEAGVSLQAMPDGIATVFLYSEGTEGAHEYSRQLPLGLNYGMGRPEVRGTLGAPPKIESDGAEFHGEEILPWDLFDCGGWYLHVEYGDGGKKVRLITLMRDFPED